MEITRQQHQAAEEMFNLIADKTGVNGQLHPGTAISAGARLAGSFMFRSFNLNVNGFKPGTPVLSDLANEKGPMLINVLGETLTSLGVNLDPIEMNQLTNVESNLSFLDTLDTMQRDAFAIMSTHHLTHEQMAYLCAMATALIIKECLPALSAESGFNTAIYGFVEGSKTCPPALMV